MLMIALSLSEQKAVCPFVQELVILKAWMALFEQMAVSPCLSQLMTLKA